MMLQIRKCILVAVGISWCTSQAQNLPTPAPSALPSLPPSVSAQPSTTPSVQPSAVPSVSALPSLSPSVSALPSTTPSVQPSAAPSVSALPSLSPSVSALPSTTPSVSALPSQTPTKAPSSAPSVPPTMSPSMTPSGAPSQFPSDVPSAHPSAMPSMEPSQHPTHNKPTKISISEDEILPFRENLPEFRESRYTTRPTRSPTPEPTVASHPQLAPLLTYYWRIGMPTSAPTGVFNFRFTKPPTGAPSSAPSGPKIAPLLKFYWQIGMPTSAPTGVYNFRPSTSAPSSAPTDPSNSPFRVFPSKSETDKNDNANDNNNNPTTVNLESHIVPSEAVPAPSRSKGDNMHDEYQVIVSAEVEGVPEILEPSSSSIVESVLVQYLSDEIIEMAGVPVFFLEARVTTMQPGKSIYGTIRMEIKTKVLAIGGNIDIDTVQQSVQQTLDKDPEELESHLRGAIHSSTVPAVKLSQQDHVSQPSKGNNNIGTILAACTLIFVIVVSVGLWVTIGSRHRIQEDPPELNKKDVDFWA
jgi:hypothetical protein